MRTSESIKALDSYLKQITINCPYPSVTVQSVNVQSCNFSQPVDTHSLIYIDTQVNGQLRTEHVQFSGFPSAAV